MEQNFRDEARRIFRRELYNMKEKGYIKPELADEVANIHFQYHLDLLEEDRKREEGRAISPAQSMPGAELVKPIMQVKVPPQPKAPKKVLTAEQIRERNITWLLNIGVIFLLIGGLFVATSNWETMTSTMKSSAIALVSLLFYGFAYVASRVLKIEKTAFAFVVLGSLFLPIFILSLGWFGLLGPYLSVEGEGRFYLGFFGSILPAAAYFGFAKKLGSRLFVWFSFLALSVAAGFLLAAFELPIDYFYLGIMGYNAAAIYLYYRLRNSEKLKLFTGEFPIFIQANLVISTLLMLFFYDSELIYSVNLLLTALIYLSMMYVSGKKEYHFVFSAMLVYGAYQLIENSFLEQADGVFFALAAFAFIFIPKGLPGGFGLDRIFKYTSAVVSILAFLYISFEGFLVRAGEPSFVLLFAYAIIAGNFLYLARIEKQKLFPYLSTAFLGAALFEGAALTDKFAYPVSLQASIYISGFLLLTFVGLLKTLRPFEPLRLPAREIGLGAMLFSVLLSLGDQKWIELGIMLLVISICLIAIRFLEKRKPFLESAIWSAPALFGFSMLAFGHRLGIGSHYVREQLGYPVYLAFGAILLLAGSFLWKKRGDGELTASFFYIAQVVYTAGLLLSAALDIDPMYIRPVLVLGGAGMYFLLYQKHRTMPAALLISAVSLGFYISAVDSIYHQVENGDGVKMAFILGGPVFLLLLALAARKKDSLLFSGFSLLGHLILPTALTVIFSVFPDWSVYSFATTILIYGISCKIAPERWQRAVFLYGAFISVFVTVLKVFEMFGPDYPKFYEFPATSLIVYLTWFVLKGELKKASAYFMAGFSILGIVVFLTNDPFTLLSYFIVAVYIMGTLAFLHKLKWDILGILPLLSGFYAAQEYLAGTNLEAKIAFLIFGAIGLLHLAVGKVAYPKLFQKGRGAADVKIDFYTITSLLYFISMYPFVGREIWMAPLPGLLIALMIWLQKDRAGENTGYFIRIGAVVFLLQPYYALTGRLDVPELFEREVQILPLVALAIFLRKAMRGRYEKFTGILQWAILIVTAAVLVADGLESSTIYDALILGTLSLVSMLSGMFYRIKSYFFVGMGVLLLNLFLQTRPFWGNMPWWGYLLIVGSILIGVASYNEWNRQRQGSNVEPLGTKLKKKLGSALKGWS